MSTFSFDGELSFLNGTALHHALVEAVRRGEPTQLFQHVAPDGTIVITLAVAAQGLAWQVTKNGTARAGAWDRVRSAILEDGRAFDLLGGAID